MTTRKAKPAAKPKRKAPAAVRAAADRAEARSAGKPITEPKVPIDPGHAAMEEAKAHKRAYIAKSRLAYTPELGAKICDAMLTRDPRTGLVRSLTEVCRDDPDLPHEETIRRWRRQYPDFAAMYAQAREERAVMLQRNRTGQSK